MIGAIKLDHTGPAGAVIGKVFGISSDQKFGFYSSLESTAGDSVSELYWTTSDNWNSLLTVTNVGEKTDVITASLTSEAAEFVLPEITLAPMESHTINVRELRRTGFRDRTGRSASQLPSSGGWRIFGRNQGADILVKEHLVDAAAGLSVRF